MSATTEAALAGHRAGADYLPVAGMVVAAGQLGGDTVAAAEVVPAGGVPQDELAALAAEALASVV